MLLVDLSGSGILVGMLSMTRPVLGGVAELHQHDVVGKNCPTDLSRNTRLLPFWAQ